MSEDDSGYRQLTAAQHCATAAVSLGDAKVNARGVQRLIEIMVKKQKWLIKLAIFPKTVTRQLQWQCTMVQKHNSTNYAHNKQ